MTKAELLEQSAKQCMSQHYVKDLALGYLRYEAVRKLNAPQFVVLCRRNMRGERFDDMVDDLILEGLTSGEEKAE